MPKYLFIFAVLAAALLFSACVEESNEEMAVEKTEQAIINGYTESGHSAVGALTLTYTGYGYVGSYCSATLIDSEWLLTAAHCLGNHSDFIVDPSMVEFYIGPDANPVGSGYTKPTNGTFYDVDAFIPHPSYSDTSYEHDIGLIHLSSPVTGVSPYPINTNDLYSLGISNDPAVFYVGYGVDNDATQTGGGVKRSTWIDIYSVDSTVYNSYFDSSGVCFGDSGGPGLRQVGGQWRPVGVNSTVAGTEANPCHGWMTHTRVDAYASWIQTTISGGTPDCNNTPSLCDCTDACLSDGTCNNSLCPGLNCGEIYECMVSCGSDSTCSDNCYYDGTSTGQIQLQALFTCLNDYCSTATDYQTCAETYCDDEINTCWSGGTGSMTCEEAYFCMVDCGSDSDCQSDCFYSASETGQVELSDMIGCMNDCSDTTSTDEEWNQCFTTNCGQEYDTCIPPDDCSMLGGDCASGLACFISFTGETRCYESNEKNVGASCDPYASALDCDDGAYCFYDDDTQSSATCHAFCYSDGNCGGSESCVDAELDSDPNLGTCWEEAVVCTDTDGDGFCAEEDDCDDSDPYVNPDAQEACGDNVDNNCNGSTDEGCGCTDADGDGFCVGEECNDADPDINPDADEICDDGVDNNCNDQIDEGCSCTDADGDGFCAEDDCNDSDPNINSDADEVCGDSVDNNCNGVAEEGCEEPCIDEDGDGVCFEADCDDSDPNAKPGAAEVCDDGVDNNCNGYIDEDCGGPCVDEDGDDFCADVDCDDSDASINPNADEVCGDGQDNNCNGEADEGCGSCTDADQDGVCEEFDCDDNDDKASPLFNELCDDGIDNNCNGVIDESCNGCTDEDGDGACVEIDCDDNDPAVTPVAEEVCGDGIDNNCNGSVDENCDETPEEEETVNSSSSSSCSVSSRQQSSEAPIAALALLLGLGFMIRRRKQ